MIRVKIIVIMGNNYVRLNLWKSFTTTPPSPLDNHQATSPTHPLDKKNCSTLPKNTMSHQYSSQTLNNAGRGNNSHCHDCIQEPHAGSGRGGRQQQQQQQQQQFANPGFINPGYQMNFSGGFMNPPQT
jgi:hypothetical protein